MHLLHRKHIRLKFSRIQQRRKNALLLLTWINCCHLILRGIQHVQEETSFMSVALTNSSLISFSIFFLTNYLDSAITTLRELYRCFQTRCPGQHCPKKIELDCKRKPIGNIHGFSLFPTIYLSSFFLLTKNFHVRQITVQFHNIADCENDMGHFFSTHKYDSLKRQLNNYG